MQTPTEMIREELLYNIPDLKCEKDQLESFLKFIQTEINEAIASGDVTTLRHIEDRLVGRTARVSLKTIHRQRIKVVAVVNTILRTLVRVGYEMPKP